MFGMVAGADARCLRAPHLGGLGVAAGNIDIAIVAARIAGIGRQDLGLGRRVRQACQVLWNLRFRRLRLGQAPPGRSGGREGSFSLPQADRNNAAYRHFMRYMVYLRMA